MRTVALFAVGLTLLSTRAAWGYKPVRRQAADAKVAADPEVLRKIENPPLEFALKDRAEADAVLARTRTYIADFSDMNLQMETRWVVAAYEKERFAQDAFWVEVSEADSQGSYTARLHCNPPRQPAAEWCRALAYYLRTGDESVLGGRFVRVSPLHPVFGIEVGTPAKVMAGMGLVWDPATRRTRAPSLEHYEFSGFLLHLELGFAAGKVSAGWAEVADADLGLVARSLRLTVVRTWSTPWGADPAQTLVGPEATLTLFLLKARVGLLRRVAGDGRNWVLSGGVGLGF